MCLCLINWEDITTVTYLCYLHLVISFSAYNTVIPAKGKALVKTDIQIALPDGCYGRVGMFNLIIIIVQSQLRSTENEN